MDGFQFVTVSQEITQNKSLVQIFDALKE